MNVHRSSESRSSRPARTSWQLLGDRNFGPFIIGKTIAAIGIWMFATVLAIVTFDLTGSAFDVGLTAGAQFVPQMVLAAWAGSLADRFQNLWQLTGSYAVAAAASLGVGLAGTFSEGHSVGFATLVISALLVGLGVAIGGPMMQTVIPAMVRPEELPAAVTIDAMPMVVGRAVGPALGAALVVFVGPGEGFLVAAFCFAFFVACLLMVRLPEQAVVEGSAAADTSVRSGISYIRRHPLVWRLLLGTAAIGVGSDPALTLAPVLSHEMTGSPNLVGPLTGCFGVGAAVGVLLTGVIRRRVGLVRTNQTGLAMLSVGLFLVTASRIGSDAWLDSAVDHTLVLLAMGIAGSGVTVAFASTTTILQARLHDGFRGRVMSLWLTAWVGSRPIAATIDGAIADVSSVGTACAVVAAFVAFVLWQVRPHALGLTPGGKARG